MLTGADETPWRRASASRAHVHLTFVSPPHAPVDNVGIMRFVKYVSASAPGSRWDVAVEYEIVQPEEEEDDEGDANAKHVDAEG